MRPPARVFACAHTCASVFQVDNAQTLCAMGGLGLVLQGLNSSEVRLQESSAFVLGSALAR